MYHLPSRHLDEINRIVRAPGVQRVGRCCAVCCACLSRGGPPRARKMPHSFTSSKDVVYCGGVDAGLCFAQPNACLCSRCRDGRLLTLGFHCRYLRRLSVHVLLPVPSLHWIWLTSIVALDLAHQRRAIQVNALTRTIRFFNNPQHV